MKNKPFIRPARLPKEAYFEYITDRGLGYYQQQAKLKKTPVAVAEAGGAGREGQNLS